MTPQQFENLRDEFLTREARILDWKRGEYSPNEDRLQNFREVEALTGLRMTEVASDMVAETYPKHSACCTNRKLYLGVDHRRRRRFKTTYY